MTTMVAATIPSHSFRGRRKPPLALVENRLPLTWQWYSVMSLRNGNVRRN